MIDILIPVLGRPHNAAPLVQNIHDTTTVPVIIHFLCSDGDTAQIKACQETGEHTTVLTKPAGPGDYAIKINHGEKFTGDSFFVVDGDIGPVVPGNPWIFQAADDLVFHHGWDTAALTAAGDTFDVIATNDLANASVKRGQFGTHNLIRRRYVTDYMTDGVALHEGYDHNFCDRELCGWAKQAGLFTFAKDSKVQHNHPLWGTSHSDPTYVKSLARFGQDRDLFLSRAHLWDYHGLSAHERKLAA